MLITILSFVVAFIVAIILVKKDYGYIDWKDVISCTVAISMFLTLIVHLVTWPLTIEHFHKNSEKVIVASKPDSRVEGEIRGGIFYVREKIEEKDYYVVLTKNGQVFKQEKLPAESTVIKETEGTPKITRNKHYTKSGWRWTIRFTGETKYIDEQDTIYVPVGTIENNIKFEVF